MPQISLSKLLTLVAASIVMLILLAVALWTLLFIDFKLSETPSEPASSSEIVALTHPNVSAETRDTLRSAWIANWQMRDNASAIDELERVLSNWGIDAETSEEISGRDQWEVQLALASLYLRNEAEKGLDILVQIFNTPETYPKEARDRAFNVALWHVTSHGGFTNTETGGLPLEDTKRLVLAPDRLGTVLGVETVGELEQIKSQEDVYPYLQKGYIYLEENASSRKLQVFAATFANYLEGISIKNGLREAIVENGLDPDNLPVPIRDATPRADEFKGRYMDMVNKARALETELDTMAADTATYPIYNDEILMGFYNVQRTYDWAADVKLDVSLDLTRVHERILTYADRYSNSSFFTGIIKAESGVKLMCQLVREGDYELENIDVARVSQALSHVLALSDEDRSRRSGMAAVADRRNHRCYDAFVFAGNNLEPEFKSFLLNDIDYPAGGWQDSDFVSR